ncbi:MAG: tetraacyldisaccharide 4'-kinase, partial [Alphaproteobacteria bacterium]
LVAGGTGKTPLVLTLLRMLRTSGRQAHAITRGYGGRARGPLRVDPARHDAATVGDEALLLGAAAPTWVARDRLAGVRAAAAAGADVAILDDGFQNPRPAKNLSLLAVDGPYGFGNGRILPAGPLRESIAGGLARADAVVVIGPPAPPLVVQLACDKPVLGARLIPRPEDAARLSGRRVLAFAGIGRPEKFFATLHALGAEVVESRPFPDHHVYRPDEIESLLARAERLQAIAVTTEKDAVRLAPDVRTRVATVAVDLVWDDPTAMTVLLARLPAPGTPARKTQGATP